MTVAVAVSGCFQICANFRYTAPGWNSSLLTERLPMKNLLTAPILTTQRLVLRGPERGDLQGLTRFMTSAPSMQAQGETVTAEQAWFGFLIGIGHWHWHGFGFFTVVEQQSGHPVGRVGLIRHSNWPDVELAWHLFEGAEGKGFATEAAMAVKKWAFEDLGFDRLHSYIDRQNTRSQAVASRLGAVMDGTRAPHEPEAEVWVHAMQRH
jgi:RimJ/RimL family protein N-acetyltransferase